MNKGTLFVVATPIGNLGDMSFRAVETLKSCAFILAENPRETLKLLNHYEIKVTVISYRDQNHDRMIGKVREKLDLGLNLALVSDAGTPLISDPGFRLVNELKSSCYNVIGIPGASSPTMALSVSGLPSDRFMFIGFLPKSDAQRESLLKKYNDLDATLILFESPNRVIKTLEQIQAILDNRKVTVAKDLTKLWESVDTGSIDKIIELYKAKDTIKGEYVILIAKEGF